MACPQALLTAETFSPVVEAHRAPSTTWQVTEPLMGSGRSARRCHGVCAAREGQWSSVARVTGAVDTCDTATAAALAGRDKLASKQPAGTADSAREMCTGWLTGWPTGWPQCAARAPASMAQHASPRQHSYSQQTCTQLIWQARFGHLLHIQAAESLSIVPTPPAPGKAPTTAATINERS